MASASQIDGPDPPRAGGTGDQRSDDLHQEEALEEAHDCVVLDVAEEELGRPIREGEPDDRASRPSGNTRQPCRHPGMRPDEESATGDRDDHVAPLERSAEEPRDQFVNDERCRAARLQREGEHPSEVDRQVRRLVVVQDVTAVPVDPGRDGETGEQDEGGETQPDGECGAAPGQEVAKEHRHGLDPGTGGRDPDRKTNKEHECGPGWTGPVELVPSPGPAGR